MLKIILEKNKLVISLLAFLVAVGTLFLTIPPSINEASNEYLLKIKFFWLIVISIIIIIFVIFTWIILSNFEDKLENKIKIPVAYFTTSYFGVTVLWLLNNLWKYFFLEYQEIFYEFYESVGSYLLFGFIGITIYLYTLPFLNYKDRKIKFLFQSLFLVTICTIVEVWWQTLGHRPLLKNTYLFKGTVIFLFSFNILLLAGVTKRLLVIEKKSQQN